MDPRRARSLPGQTSLRIAGRAGAVPGGQRRGCWSLEWVPSDIFGMSAHLWEGAGR